MSEEDQPLNISNELVPQPAEPQEEAGLPFSEGTKVEPTGPSKTGFERKLGMASTMVQILAILAAGLFAITKFGIFDRPTLENNLRVSGSLDWTARGQNYCLADLGTEVTNMSKSDIAIGQVRAQAWLMNEPATHQGSIEYFDLFRIAETQTPIRTVEYVQGPLLQLYVPGQSSHHTFEWFIERKKDTYVFFKVAVFKNQGDKEPVDFQYQWDLVCGDKQVPK